MKADRMRREEIAKAYATQNTPALQKAVEQRDDDAIDRIIADARQRPRAA